MRRTTGMRLFWILGLGWAGGLLGAWSGDAVAEEKRLCIRNYLKPASSMDPCARGIPNFAYVVDDELPGEPICTKIYEDRHCKFSSQEFDHAIGPDGEAVCTLNFNQPPISMSCATNPDLYQWVTAAYPD